MLDFICSIFIEFNLLDEISKILNENRKKSIVSNTSGILWSFVIKLFLVTNVD